MFKNQHECHIPLFFYINFTQAIWLKIFGSKGHISYHGKGTLHHIDGGITSIKSQECHLKKWGSDENTVGDQVFMILLLK